MGSFVPWTGYFRFTLLQKGASAVAIIAPRSPRRGGGEEGPGEEYVVNFAHRIIREEGPKSRKWDPRGLLSCELLFLRMCSQQFIRRRTTALESHHYRHRHP